MMVGTVKTLMFACPFISQAKQRRRIKGHKYRYCTTVDWHRSRVGIVWFEFAKI